MFPDINREKKTFIFPEMTFESHSGMLPFDR